jgi:hypothetical protein
LCQPRVIVKMIVEKQIECRLAGETEVLGENLPQCHFCPSQNPTCPDPGLNPDRRGEKPATNRLSCGASWLNTLQPYGPPWPVTGISLLIYLLYLLVSLNLCKTLAQLLIYTPSSQIFFRLHITYWSSSVIGRFYIHISTCFNVILDLFWSRNTSPQIQFNDDKLSKHPGQTIQNFFRTIRYIHVQSVLYSFKYLKKNNLRRHSKY